jgi:[protein-PII] uridylyltransferase
VSIAPGITDTLAAGVFSAQVQPILEEFADSDQRPGVIARKYVERVREVLAARHFAGASGSEIVKEFTEAIDRLVVALYRRADEREGSRFPRLNRRFCLIARGGYGRAELNPYSDIDLLFVHDWKPEPYVEVVTEAVLHALWDAGLTVGHSLQGVRECVALAKQDFKERTAILSLRLLAGDERLFAEFDRIVSREVLENGRQQFFKAKLQESRERHAHYGDSVYLLEPNIKDGQGGLRDLHTALWLARVRYGACSLGELAERRIITEAELAEVRKSRDFLWRLRNSLHFLANRHTDQLTFDYQERIGALLGFRDRDGEVPGASLMKAYYGHASTIYWFAEGLIARMAEEPAPSRFLRRRKSVRRLRPGVVIQDRVLSVADRDFFHRDPVNLVTIFADCQAHGVELAGNTYQLVRDCLGLIDERVRESPQTSKLLMEILNAPERVAETFEAMHRAGVLGAVIPEFGKLYAQVLHDLYHIYTVDRHSLAAVRELQRLRTGEFKESAQSLTEVAREVDFLALIFLALLLHDIGKGYGHDHHERGALLAAQVCRRLGLDGEQTDLVVFLVREHLTMSHVAQKGDIDDPATVADFARRVGSIDRLQALYLLTFADMRAVAPNVYNSWRDMLLSDLYLRALRVLEEGDREAFDPVRRLALAQAAVAEQLATAGASDSEVGEFLAAMPDRYFLTVLESDSRSHFDLMRSLDGRLFACSHRHFPERDFSEFTVATRDQPGLFSKIAGVLTASHLNILSARITTSTSGVALDVFRVSHLEGGGALAMDEERWTRVERDLGQVLSGKSDIVELVTASRRSAPLRRHTRRVPTEVRIDNPSSAEFTVVDVFTQDQVGLLFAITHTLFSLGLVIHLARISTYADQAIDVFYISEGDGRKVERPERIQALRERLTARLAEDWPEPVA